MTIAKILQTSAREESSNFDTIDYYDTKTCMDGKDYIFGYNGAISHVIQFTPIFSSPLTLSDFRNIKKSLSEMLIEVGSPDISISFHLINTTNMEVVSGADNLPEVVKEKIRYRDKLAKDGELFRKIYLITIKSAFSAEELTFVDRLKYNFNNAKAFITKQSSVENLEKETTGIAQRFSKVSQISRVLIEKLRTIEIEAKSLEKKQIEEIYREILAPSKFKELKEYNPPGPNESPRRVVASGVNHKDLYNHALIDDYVYQVYELERILPQKDVYEKDILSLMSLKMEYIYTTVLNVMPKEKAQKAFSKALKHANSQLKLGQDYKGEVEDLSLETEHREISDARVQLYQENNGAIEFSSFFIPRETIDKARYNMNKSMQQNIQDYLYAQKERINRDFFKKIGGSEWKIAEKGQFELLCRTLPGVASLDRRYFRTMVEIPSNIPFILPLYGEVRGGQTYYGFNHFYTNSMEIAPYLNIDPTLPAFTTLVAGATGSGKSVTLNNILVNSHTSMVVSGKKPLVRILEIGGASTSYYKLITALGGEYVRCNGAKPPRIQAMELSLGRSYPNKRKIDKILNFFKKNNILQKETDEERLVAINSYYQELMSLEEVRDRDYEKNARLYFQAEHSLIKDVVTLHPGECKPDPQKKNTILAIFEIMLSSNFTHLDGFSTFLKDDIESLIDNAYEEIEGRFPRVGDIYEKVRAISIKKSDPVLNRMANKLSQWTLKEGTYKMFDMETNIDLKNNYLVFDLFGLEHTPALEAIYMILITDLITRDMYERTGMVKVSLIDEAWKIANKSRAMMDVIEGFYRLSRKYKFQIAMASQRISDFSPTVISQTMSFIICGVNNDDEIYKTIGATSISEEFYSEIKKLGLQKELRAKNISWYSKFMKVDLGKNNKDKQSVSILCSILSPLEFEYMNSNAEDNAITKYFVEEEEKTVDEACVLISKGGHIGHKPLLDYLLENNSPEAYKKCLPKEN